MRPTRTTGLWVATQQSTFGKPAYLSVKTDGAAADSEVKVRWTYGEQGQLVKEDSRKIPAGGEAWSEFHISKPSGFPRGDYRVTAFVNGQEKGTKRFEVK
jgi:hypothetical protein